MKYIVFALFAVFANAEPFYLLAKDNSQPNQYYLYKYIPFGGFHGYSKELLSFKLQTEAPLERLQFEVVESTNTAELVIFDLDKRATYLVKSKNGKINSEQLKGVDNISDYFYPPKSSLEGALASGLKKALGRGKSFAVIYPNSRGFRLTILSDGPIQSYVIDNLNEAGKYPLSKVVEIYGDEQRLWVEFHRKDKKGVQQTVLVDVDLTNKKIGELVQVPTDTENFNVMGYNAASQNLTVRINHYLGFVSWRREIREPHVIPQMEIFSPERLRRLNGKFATGDFSFSVIGSGDSCLMGLL